MAISISLTESVLKDVNKLPKEIRLKFIDQVQILLKNPLHPSLRNKKLAGRPEWEFSITMQYRALYLRTEKEIVIVAVGTHKEVLGN